MHCKTFLISQSQKRGKSCSPCLLYCCLSITHNCCVGGDPWRRNEGAHVKVKQQKRFALGIMLQMQWAEEAVLQYAGRRLLGRLVPQTLGLNLKVLH